MNEHHQLLVSGALFALTTFALVLITNPRVGCSGECVSMIARVDPARAAFLGLWAGLIREQER